MQKFHRSTHVSHCEEGTVTGAGGWVGSCTGTEALPTDWHEPWQRHVVLGSNPVLFLIL